MILPRFSHLVKFYFPDQGKLGIFGRAIVLDDLARVWYIKAGTIYLSYFGDRFKCLVEECHERQKEGRRD